MSLVYNYYSRVMYNITLSLYITLPYPPFLKVFNSSKSPGQVLLLGLFTVFALRKTVSVTVSLLNNSSNVNHFITIQAGYILSVWSIAIVWRANKKKLFELHKFHWTRSAYTSTSQGCPVHRLCAILNILSSNIINIKYVYHFPHKVKISHATNNCDILRRRQLAV